jgi:hypothetical protein
LHQIEDAFVDVDDVVWIVVVRIRFAAGADQAVDGSMVAEEVVEHSGVVLSSLHGVVHSSSP